MNILSLFDGMSCGQQALQKANIKVSNYYASEIDKYAISVTRYNYPNTNFIGSVTDIDIDNLPHIDILIGGSPCQGFSFAGKQKGASTKCNIEIITLSQYLELKEKEFEFQGQSYLFWEYIRILRALQKKNPKLLFLLENVKMTKKWQSIFDEAVGVKPIEINSALMSAQNRKRLYWTNINNGIIPQPEDKGILLKDIIQIDVEDKYFLSEKAIAYINREDRIIKKLTAINGNKALCLMRQYDQSKNGTFLCVDSNGRIDEFKTGTVTQRYFKGSENYGSNPFLLNTRTMKYRKLTPLECERLQTLKDNYTVKGLNENLQEVKISNTQRYKMIGNGWTVDVISYILSYIKGNK